MNIPDAYEHPMFNKEVCGEYELSCPDVAKSTNDSLALSRYRDMQVGARELPHGACAVALCLHHHSCGVSRGRVAGAVHPAWDDRGDNSMWSDC